MIIYVDGTALLRHLAETADPLAEASDLHERRGNLTRWLARYCELQDCRAVLVFDGSPPGEVLPPTERHGGVKVVNVAPGVEARTEIAGPANRSAQDERTLVVTADHRLVCSLEGGQARALGPGEFVARVRRSLRPAQEALADEPDEKFGSITDQEVDFWMRFFGERD